MRYLLDTHLLLWAASGSAKLPAKALNIISSPANELHFSAASIWEVTIKNGLGRADFQVDPRVLRRGLLENGYLEIAVSSLHAAAVGDLPDIHKDPFDRLLIAQVRAESMLLLTSDATVARYGASIKSV